MRKIDVDCFGRITIDLRLTDHGGSAVKVAFDDETEVYYGKALLGAGVPFGN